MTLQRTRWDDYFAWTRQLVARGALLYSADFVQAQRVRRVTLRPLRQLFEQVDLMAAPTAGLGAPRYDDRGTVDLTQFFRYSNTAYWDSVGNPALVVPMGFAEGGLPLSLQLAARPFEEAAI